MMGSPIRPNRPNNDGMRPRVLLVGAFERDNFGDLLLALVTRDFLASDFEVDLTTPFESKTSELLPVTTRMYTKALEAGSPDAVWVVGGEIGGVTGAEAARMTGASPDEMDAELESPYIPRPSQKLQTLDVPLVINSAGLSGIATGEPHQRIKTAAAIREADLVSVRDRRSFEALENLDLQTRLAPDVVHAIGRILRPPSRPRNTVVVQFKERLIDDRGVQRLVETLTEDERLRDMGITFVPAGISPGHDSIETYCRMMELIQRVQPERDVEVFRERDPLDIASQIAGSRLFIGTSLHGRIVAETFGVPRVSISFKKVDRYCDYWDPSMPFAVQLDTLRGALDCAMSGRGSHDGRRLAAVAESNAEAMRDYLWAQLDGRAATARLRRRLKSLEIYRREQQDVLSPNYNHSSQ